MKENKKKILSLCLLVIMLMSMLVACGNSNNDSSDKDSSDKITEQKLNDLQFNDATVEYNGKTQKLTIENIYEEKGVKISYKNNANTVPGTYTITATIEYEDIKITKKAVLTITKAKSVLEAASEQSIQLLKDEFKFSYTLSNKSQTVKIVDENGNPIKISSITKPGVYNVELYAPENNNYLESNHVKVVLTVFKSALGIKFENKEVIATGEEQALLIEGDLPSGYTVDYENNVGITDGNYFATASIKDSEGNVVEKHNAVLKIENPENEEFQKYLDEFFVEYLEDDQLSVNIFCEDPSKFGLEHYEAKWYTYETIGEEEITHDLNLFKEMLDELESFKDEPLNDLQESAYITIENFLQYYVEYYSIEDSFFSQILYIDQFGGYVADFGTYMEAYSLRSELEVQDIVKYIESTKEAFPSYLMFLEDKTKEGYPLSNFTITEMRTYLEDILEEGEEYYLKGILNEKISKLEFLDENQKEEYKNKVSSAIKDCFIPGVQELYDGLEQYLDKLNSFDEGYYAAYENGEELFMLKLENLLGYDNMNKEEYIKELDDIIKSTIDEVIYTQTELIENYNIVSYEQLEYIINKNAIYEGTPDEMMIFLEEFAKTIVKELNQKPDIVIKEMDEASAKVSNAVAYYMKSALDNTSSEYITLNPVKLGESTTNDVLGTLAHEGYPGHLYAYVYSKELGLSNLATVMTSTAHGEGWATYVELKLYEYAMENSNDKQFVEVMKYLYANQLSGFLLETRLDAGIHLEGWGVKEVANYMDELGYSPDSAKEIYNLLIEMPTQYAAYGYGKLVFYNLHKEAQDVLGVYYDEIEFNAMLLSKGWTNLDILEATYNEYMEIKCHELGIEWK